MLGVTASGATLHALSRIGSVGLITAFIAVVMRAASRVRAQREQAIQRGTPPLVPTIRGLRPAKSQWWWWTTPFLKTPEGAQALDRLFRIVAWAGLGVFILSLLALLAIELI